MNTCLPGGRKYLAALLLLALLSGCATTSRDRVLLDKQQVLAKWQQRQDELTTLTGWSLQGKMGVRTGPKGGSATLNWEYNGDSENIELYGPFGGGRVVIEADSNGASLRDSGDITLSGTNASDVLYQRLGWQVPFAHLKNWARGLPGDGATNVVVDNQGRLKSLVLDNWRVQYEDYQEVNGTSVPGLELPYRIKVNALPGTMALYSDNGEYLGDELSVQLLLRRWWEIGVNQ